MATGGTGCAEGAGCARGAAGAGGAGAVGLSAGLEAYTPRRAMLRPPAHSPRPATPAPAALEPRARRYTSIYKLYCVETTCEREAKYFKYR